METNMTETLAALREELAEATRGDFMKPQCYHDAYWLIENTRGESFVIPAAGFRPPDGDVGAFADCIEGTPAFAERLEGWLCRFSAPGYMDCTEWSAFPTEREALEFLLEFVRFE